MTSEEIKHIIKNLESREAKIREYQLKVLQKVPLDVLYTQIKDILENPTADSDNSDYNAAELSIILLGELGIDLLIEVVSVASISLRWHIVGLLGDMQSTKSIAFLINVLFNDLEPHIRIQAALSLGRLGGADALAALQSVLNKDFGEDHEGRTVSETAAYAIETYF